MIIKTDRLYLSFYSWENPVLKAQELLNAAGFEVTSGSMRPDGMVDVVFIKPDNIQWEQASGAILGLTGPCQVMVQPGYDTAPQTPKPWWNTALPYNVLVNGDNTPIFMGDLPGVTPWNTHPTLPANWGQMKVTRFIAIDARDAWLEVNPPPTHLWVRSNLVHKV